MMTDTTTFNFLPFPLRTRATLVTLFVAGSLATIAFELFGQALSPLFGFARLAPAGLADGVIKTILGANISGGGHLLHYLVGLLGYAIGWMFVAEPIARRFAPSLPTLVAAAIYGVVLWVFALFVMAHLVVGMPAFLGFTGITWVALVGHVIYAVVLAVVVDARRT